MYHVEALLFFVFGWLSTIVCQMAPFGIESLLFGGLGGFPQQQPMGIPFGFGGLFGQGQFSPSAVGMPSGMGGFPMPQLPFPLFPMPCEMVCDHGGLFFANININQSPGGSMPGMPGGGFPGMPGGGMPGGGRPGGGAPSMPGGGMPGFPPPGGMPGFPPGGMPGMPPGGGGNRPGGGLPGGGMPTTNRPPSSGGGLPPTTMPTRPPSMPSMPSMPLMPQSPSVNAQFLYFMPNWSPYRTMAWPSFSFPFYG